MNKPVRVQWMRWDQHGWDHHGVANMYDVKMGVDASGKIVAADWQTYGQAQQQPRHDEGAARHELGLRHRRHVAGRPG